ncbi:MAG: fumarylacetoacetate hydrolase family protein [Rhizobiales bacterium]|nr:fumarylacetoacetate hydrolase family protein [Hyphomicrobiales bacterium]
MTSEHYLFPPQPQPSLPIDGTALRFPVHRIYCVGRNYAAHALEMGGSPEREPPFFFQKNAEDIVEPGHDVAFPPQTQDLHHEVELVVAIGKGGHDIDRADALAHVYGYAVGLDLTRRDVQAEAKRMSRPWNTAKSFADSAPTGPIVPAERIGHPASGRIAAAVDGEPRQDGDLAAMIWPVPDIVAALSRWYGLVPGDLIFTGTPAGVGTLHRGNRVTASVEGVGSLDVLIV